MNIGTVLRCEDRLWRCGSRVQCLPGIGEAPALIPSSGKPNKTKNKSSQAQW